MGKASSKSKGKIEKTFRSLKELEQEYFPISSKKKNKDAPLFDTDHILTKALERSSEDQKHL